MLSTQGILAIIAGLVIFLAPIIAWILITNNINIFKLILDQKIGWILVLSLQAIYLGLDLTEATTDVQLFGVLAGVFMALLGGIIIFIIILESVYHKKKIAPSHLIEGCFYLIIGIALAVLRSRKKKVVCKEDEDHEKND